MYTESKTAVSERGGGCGMGFEKGAIAHTQNGDLGALLAENSRNLTLKYVHFSPILDR